MNAYTNAVQQQINGIVGLNTINNATLNNNGTDLGVNGLDNGNENIEQETETETKNKKIN